MKFWLAFGASLVAVGVLMAAIPFTYQCDKDAGFVMDPGQHARFGYITSLHGFSAPALNSDLTLTVPFTPSNGLFTIMMHPLGMPAVTSVVGVISTFSWNGGANDPLNLGFYVSPENATLLKALQQSGLQNSTVSSLAWWIGDYDQTTQSWFEEAYPKSSQTVSGMLPQRGVGLSVDLNPVPVKDGIDVLVYKVSLQVAPTPKKVSTLFFAQSSKTSVLRAWGSL